MTQIVDGGGSGRVAKVDKDQRLLTTAIAQPLDQHINAESGKAWSISFDGLNPAGDGDYVIYIKNDGVNDLRIPDIRIKCDTAASQLEIHEVTGAAVGGSDITPVSRTVGSGALPTATIQSGTDITGLTSGGILFYIQCVTVDKEEHLSTSSNIDIPKGRAIALLIEEGTANVTGVISLVESDLSGE